VEHFVGAFSHQEVRINPFLGQDTARFEKLDFLVKMPYVTKPSTRNHDLLQTTGILFVVMLLSRVFGFLREWTVAHQLGSSAVTDTYYAAFTLPDLLSYLVAGGTIGMFFIPVFTKYITEKREDEGWHVYSTITTCMTLVLIGLISLGEIFAHPLVRLIAPGFDPAQQARAVFLTRLMLPSQLFLFIAGVASSVQNVKSKFLVPALGPVVYNLGIILGGWLLTPRIGVAGFAVGVLAGSFLGFFVLQLFGLRNVGARFTPNLDLNHPGFRMFLRLGIPIMLALSFDVTDEWIIRWFGSYLTSASITWLTYARTLMRFPQIMIGSAIGIASFPLLAQLHSKGESETLNRTLNTTLKGLILFLVPLSALAIVLSKPVVYFAFSHTRLNAADFQATGAALGLFSIGIFARAAQNFMARGFYAVHDTITPAVVGTSVTFLSLPLYWYCARHWHFLGLAIASSAIAIAFAAVLFALLVRRTHNREARGLLLCLAKVLASSVLVALLCYKLTAWLEARLAWQNTLGALELLVIVTAVGFPSIILLAKLLGVDEIDRYLRKILSWFPTRVLVAPE
jgi:putative peptidoglycan lipid II flippase